MAELEIDMKKVMKGFVETAIRQGLFVERWVPVSERLPEVMDGTNGECSDDVLICVADDERITISTGFYGYYPRSTSQQGWWSVWAYGCHQLDNKYKVVAWMPLPEPYKSSPTGAESEDVPDINNGNIYVCSCGYGWDKSKVVRHHFCPNCGAKVAEGNKE